MPVGNLPILRNIGGAIAPPAPPVPAHLPLTLFSFLPTWTFWNVGDQTTKIPEIEIIPTSIPNIYIIPVPKISPKCFWGFLGKKPQKSPKLNLSPSPKNPQNWSKGLPHPRPVPEIRGGDGENRGSGPRFTTLVHNHWNLVLNQLHFFHTLSTNLKQVFMKHW